MHLKKWLCLLVAVTVANAAFAGTMFSKKVINPALSAKTIKTLAAPPSVTGKYPDKSQLEYLINNSFVPYEIMPLLQPVSEELEPYIDTATALRAGLLAYAADVKAERNLTGNNKAIDEILSQIPTIFNKIQTSSDEISDEIIPVLENLCDKIVANQNKINATAVNRDIATQQLMFFVYQKAELDGTLLGRVSTIIQQELQEALETLESMQ